MGLNLLHDIPIPSVQESEERIADDAVNALAYLKRTDNMDIAPILGLVSEES